MRPEKITARYDPVDDIIRGCKEGSKEWWHEKRHQQQHRLIGKIINFMDFVRDYTKYTFSLGFVLLLFMPIAPLTYFTAISMITFIISALFELALELDAECYTWRQDGKETKA